MRRISVIVPTLERPERLRPMLQSLSRQVYEDFEVMVIDQSRDARLQVRHIVEDMRRRGLQMRLFYQNLPNASRARNVGILESTGEIVLFLDDDIEVDQPDFLWNHARNYEEPEVGGVAGQILGPDRAVRFERHWMSYRRRVGWLYFPQNYAFRTWVESGRSANLSVRRSLAVAVGGMDERYERGAHREEADFCWRCVQSGVRFVFDPGASVVHYEERTGGVRWWDDGRSPVAFHHLVGELYFVLKNVEPLDYLDHLFVAMRRHVLCSRYRRAPWEVPRASARLLRALIRALLWLREGPKYMDSARQEGRAIEVL